MTKPFDPAHELFMRDAQEMADANSRPTAQHNTDRREWLHWRIKDLQPHSWTVCRGDYPTSNLGPYAEWVRVREVLPGEVTITREELRKAMYVAAKNWTGDNVFPAIETFLFDGPWPEGTPNAGK